jgi:hypothetical protein
MTKELELRLYEAKLNLHKSQKSRKEPELLDEDFAAQTNFIKDPSRLKAALCTRRAGKSYGAALDMFRAAFKHAGSSILYIALTRESAKKIMWKDCIKVINRKFDLKCRFNETALTATLPNGSVLYLTGADAKPDEMEKILGQKFPLVVIDESAAWKQDLEKLVYGILVPAVADYGGTIEMIGTPGNLIKTFFHRVTDGEVGGWSVHKWTAFDNPHVKKRWAEEIDGLKLARPGIEDTALFKQMYLGEWHVDESSRCYKYTSKNLVDHLPARVGRDFYVLGVDLGYSDATAFSLTVYSEHNDALYVTRTEKRKGMIISDVAERLRWYDKEYPDLIKVVDGANLQAVEEIRQRYGLALKVAEKTNKAEFIEIMNADLITGRVKLLESETEALTDEWDALVWDEDSDRRIEHASCENHLADATLYAWRYSYNYLAKPFIPKPKLGSEAEVDAFWEQEAQKIQRRRSAES